MASNPEDQMVIRLDRVVEQDFPAVIKLAAMTVQQKGYLSPGDFFKSLNAVDLTVLLEMVDATGPGAPYGADVLRSSMDALVVLSVTLALGEGAADITYGDAEKHLQTTVLFIALEGLFRKDLIELDRSAMSYVDEGALARLKGAPPNA